VPAHVGHPTRRCGAMVPPLVLRSASAVTFAVSGASDSDPPEERLRVPGRCRPTPACPRGAAGSRGAARSGRRPRDRFHTFSVGAFVGHRPLFAVVSNFESVYARPSRVPRPSLHASYLRPRRARVVVTGRPSAVLRPERQSLIGLIRSDASSETVMNALAKVNAVASTREVAYISPRCFTSFVRFTGEGGGMVHGLAGGAYMPSFMVPEQMKEAIDALVKEHFPQGAQLRSISSSRAEATESYHRIQLREKPNDPNVHNNFGAYLLDVRKDSVGAEAAYTRATK